MKDIGDFFDSGALPKDRPITLFEIGAHTGFHTGAFLQTFPLADLWAFEPDPRNFAELRRQRYHERARIFELAIGDRDGRMDMHLSTGPVQTGDVRTTLSTWTFSSSLKKPLPALKAFPWVKFTGIAKVKVARLDTLKSHYGFGDIDFMWVDVQGAEDMVIAGGQQTLARTRYLFTEYANVEYYQGQINLREILARLPGGEANWAVVADFGDDVLLRNVSMDDATSPR